MQIEAIRKVVSILFGAGLTVGCALLIGRLILARLRGVAHSAAGAGGAPSSPPRSTVIDLGYL